MRAVIALAFATHLLAVVLMLALHPALALTPDSESYTRPAHNILAGRDYDSPYRYPGYPLIIAAGIALTGHELAVLLVAPFAAAGACAAIMQLAARMNPRSAAFAGVLFALYPPSLALTGLLMTDALGGYLVVMAVWATVAALEK